MKYKFFKSILTASVIIVSNSVSAGVIFFSDDPENNSGNFSSAAFSTGYEINQDIDFEEHVLGNLNGAFYTDSNGVTLTSSTSNLSVLNNIGPSQGNVTNSIEGEGIYQASNYLNISSQNDFTLNFEDGTYGVGLTTIDLFESGDITLNVFSGQNGTGDLLGSLSGIGEGLNFQSNGTFFIGVQSDDTLLGSVTYSFSGDGGDVIGYDDIVYLVNNTVSVPEPSSSLIALFVLLCFGIRKVKKK